MDSGIRLSTVDDQGRPVDDWMNSEPIDITTVAGTLTFQAGAITMTFTEPDD